MLESIDMKQGACYSNRSLRDIIIFNITRQIYYIFNSADRIKFAESICDNFYNTGESGMSDFEPDLLGSLKIITTIENYFKALLLSEDFVIHKISGTKAKDLYRRQKKEPIRIMEIFALEEITLPLNGHVVFKYLDIQTLNISNILNSKAYLDLSPLSSILKDFLVDINNKRNSLHYLVPTGIVYSNGINLQFLNLKKELNEEIKALNNKAGIASNFYSQVFL